ncbi:MULTISPECIES: helix-turn-helix domain-containing protein [Acinetobacter calcoaceticus/baumannii complex]|uniref:helix-turn-helix domain-containing protein n=1 Tax=Acinetobacter calcoaceticus/baumannii complex TaxID=909768 RepID=UPI00353119ED
MLEFTIQFSQLVCKYREEKNMSQKQLVLVCNMDRYYLGRIERGKVNPTLENVYDLAKNFKVLPVQLLS